MAHKRFHEIYPDIQTSDFIQTFCNTIYNLPGDMVIARRNQYFADQTWCFGNNHRRDHGGGFSPWDCDCTAQRDNY